MFLSLGQTFRMRSIGCGSVWLIVALLGSLAIAGCTTPVGVERGDPQTLYQQQTHNVLDSGDPSEASRIVLTRWNLNQQFAENPAAALAALRATLANGTGGSDETFALAELSFQHAGQRGDRAYYLAAVVYAYAFLFPNAADAAPNPYDPRLRTASDLYNRGLTLAFRSADQSRVELHGGEFALPFGNLLVAFDPASLVWAGRKLDEFIPIDDYEVRGLRNTYRQSGIGAPLAANGVPLNPEQVFQVAPRMKIPVTAVLRIANASTQIVTGNLDATLEVYPPSDAETIHIGGQQVPLEVERSATLAYSLSDPELWARELRGFLTGDLLDKIPSRLVALAPHLQGKFPVVFIHGTASSAGRWADTVNELLSDPRIRDHFEFWFFSYDTGNPIPYSAMLLREALQAAVTKIDPSGQDPALRHIVLIGHSQGGLLAKMLVVDPGNSFWDSISQKPLNELDMTADTRDLVRRSFFFEHSPYVSRVIFLATPQRGSYVAGFSVAQLVARFVKLPLRVAQALGDVITNNADALRFDPSKTRTGGSVYGMAPGSPFINALAPVPIVPSVAAHSIIAVKGDGPVESGDDGVVEYSSAHISGVASELVVQSGHSSQSNPQAIAEIHRILLLHLKDACAVGVGAGCVAGATTPVATPTAINRDAAFARLAAAHLELSH